MLISSTEIRKQFIDYFKNKEHHFVHSASVVPHDDPTLLFTNAGMNQFKSYFIGTQRPNIKRAVNSQKCIRVSGKHNDLEEVGVDEYHHTFFEMLGNWSFGDYYKKEAICWAWELLTEVWDLDKKRLWITIFEDDDESGQIWKENTDISPKRILKFSNKDNFWEMGEIGPCGPCTEIHYYTGNHPDNQSADGVNKLSEYREIWNLVFIQYNRDKNGKLNELPDKHVDTGAGLERLVAILNGKVSNYETDLFIPLLEKVVELTGKDIQFEEGIPHRVIADHVRMLSFSLVDGAMPGNDGRGYVLRRILRRAARFGRILEMNEPFIYKIVNTLCKIMGDTFPELLEKQKHIQKVIHTEEKSFNETLDRGLTEYTKIISQLKMGNSIAGEDVFKLYDTFGFPLDLTELMAREDGFQIDIETFNECMLRQKELARISSKFYQKSNDGSWIMVSEPQATKFTGYKESSSHGKIIKYKVYDDQYEIVLDRTPFYAESGGQVGDMGWLIDGEFSFNVADVKCIEDEYIHIGAVRSGNIKNVKSVHAKIDEFRRKQIQRNHTATHLLHQALKDVLGEHIQQAGSLVAPESLRFDLTHYEPISDQHKQEIESLINSVVMDNKEILTEIKTYSAARKDGAISLFGEKYGNKVRVVNVPGFSKELCGGTHVKRSGEIGCIKIISESALATGVRRIVAVTGDGISKLLTKQSKIIFSLRAELNCSEEDIFPRLKASISERKNFEKENKKLKQLTISDQINELIASARNIGDLRLVIDMVDDPGDLKDLGDKFRKAFRSHGISLIGTVQKKKPVIMCAITDDLINKIQAGNIVKEIGGIMGGGGGGKPHIATAGGNDINLLQDALDHGKNMIESIFSNNV